MDIRKIKKLIELIDESGVTEIEIKEGEESIRICKAVVAAAIPAGPATILPIAAPQQGPVVEPEPADDLPAGDIVTSPMVGTFYRAPSPTSAAFVDSGSPVKQGDVLCIVEAMKLMNQIDSEFSGTVKAILVDDGQAVEYGQPLFVIG
ncbi:MAG: acetyl-CoA carboxylase biotin carboxyl carrier protein [Gammaproteobacteria bacterium]|nr:MAG: acetyl-CoA carboxylase biotin carboxyl carrier protein [Gammaproteobacteria bacterium]